MRRARVVGALVGGVVSALCVASCGADAGLAHQEARVRALTCASLTERHDETPVTVPSTRWFLPRVEQRADSQASVDDRSGDNDRELHKDCDRARHHVTKP